MCYEVSLQCMSVNLLHTVCFLSSCGIDRFHSFETGFGYFCHVKTTFQKRRVRSWVSGVLSRECYSRFYEYKLVQSGYIQ
jgi:hypothetical protein